MATTASDTHGHDPSPGHDAHDHAKVGHGDGHGHEAHPAHLAHHFDTPEQQFGTSKLGMWTFLATEVLMFGGLFVAYSVLRHNNPEVFLWAHKALDWKWGAIDTAILLASSYTMAWGVRAAQLNQRGLLMFMLALTFAGGLGFMGIKAIEYEAKWRHHLFPGKLNVLNVEYKGQNFKAPLTAEQIANQKEHTIDYVDSHDKPAGGEHTMPAKQESGNGESSTHGDSSAEVHTPPVAHDAPPVIASVHAELIGTPVIDPHEGTANAAKIKPPVTIPGGVKLDALEPHQGGHAIVTYGMLHTPDQKKINAFFSIYFMMTGLHGFHVLVGMGVMVWLFIRATRGEFHSEYYTPVDLGGLYWHLVDLIWIFLFPLLYLIH